MNKIYYWEELVYLSQVLTPTTVTTVQNTYRAKSYAIMADLELGDYDTYYRDSGNYSGKWDPVWQGYHIEAQSMCYLPMAQTKDTQYTGKYFVGLDESGTLTTRNISLSQISGSEFKSTGGDETGIGGLFGYANNTSGHISNINFDFVDNELYRNYEQQKYTGGLVGYLYGYDVSDCTIKNVEIGTSDSTLTLYKSTGIGGAIGYAEYVNLTNVDVENVTISSTQHNYIGGIVGSFNGEYDSYYYMDGCSVTNCSITGLYSVGGVVGNVYDSVIKNGEVIDFQVSGTASVGGVVGYGYGDYMFNTYGVENYVVKSSTTVSEISATSDVGGIVGDAGSGFYVKDSTAGTNENNNSYVKATSSYAGGIAGNASSESNLFKNNKNYMNVSGVNFIAGIISYLVYGDCIENKNYGSIYATGSNVAGIVGYFEYSNYYYCKENLNNGPVTGVNYVGGIAGYAYYTSFVDNVNGANGTITGQGNVGGLVGILEDYYSPIYASEYGNSYNEGSITSTGEFVGGIVGFTSSPVYNLYNSGNVTFNNSSSEWADAGGIVGKIEGVDAYVYDCYNSGDIQGNAKSVGGIAGCACEGVSIRRCTTAMGSVVISERGGFAGGIAGFTYGTVYIGNSEDGRSVVNNASVKAFQYSGGIVGYTEGDPTITYAHNTGSITIDDTANTSGYAYVGGIVGNATGTATISYSYNDGYITVASGNYVGGIVGNFAGISLISNVNRFDVSGYSYTGGIAGNVDYQGKTSNPTILNNELALMDSVTDNINIVGYSYVGGLYGYLRGVSSSSRIAISSKGAINWCGNVTGTGYYTGGLIGYAYNVNISGSEAEAVGTSSAIRITGYNTYIGGLTGYAGYTDFFIVENYATVRGSGSNADYVGGIVGWATGITSGSYGVISTMENNGTVTSVNGDNVGGIAGYLSQSVVNLLRNRAKVSGYSYVGGLCGYSYASAVKTSYNYATVVGNHDSASATTVGGLFGVVQNTKSGQSYAVESCQNGTSGTSSTVTGRTRVGGVAGDLTSATIYKTTNYMCVAAGMNVVGGIVGIMVGSAVLDDCDISTNFDVIACNGNGQAGGMAGRADGTTWAIKSCQITTVSVYSGTWGTTGSFVGFVASSGCSLNIAESCSATNAYLYMANGNNTTSKNGIYVVGVDSPSDAGYVASSAYTCGGIEKALPNMNSPTSCGRIWPNSTDLNTWGHYWQHWQH